MAVDVANAVTMAEPVDLIDAMAVGASVSVPALAAGDRDARLGRTTGADVFTLPEPVCLGRSRDVIAGEVAK